MAVYQKIKNLSRQRVAIGTVSNQVSNNSLSSAAVTALDLDGYAWAWGTGSEGALGDGTTTAKSFAVSVLGDRRFSTISSHNGPISATTTVALDLNGYAWAWGAAADGALGDGTIASKSSPVSVLGGIRFQKIKFTSSSTAIALDLNGYAWAWGAGGTSLLGDGTAASKSSPVSVLGGRRFQDVAAPVNAGPVFALDLNGYAWAWGPGTTGALGNSSTLSQNSPVSVLGGRRFSAITCVASASAASALAIDVSGYAWAWGAGANGLLGNQAVGLPNTSSPVSVLGGRRFSAISASNRNVVALDLDGYAWAWGDNANGRLGDGTIVSRSSPVSVLGGRRFQKIAALNGFILALDLDGYAWAWGLGSNGQLGDATTTSRSSPVSVAGGRRFQNFYASQSNPFVHCVDFAGQVWTWGDNIAANVLGHASLGSRSSPVSTVVLNRLTDIFGKQK